MMNYFSRYSQPKVVLSAVAGTSMMTVYSYLLSWTKNKNFKEPKLLGTMVYRLIPGLRSKDSWLAGWGMHYLVGLLFAEIYAPFWPDGPRNRLLRTGMVLGGISGIAAILIWRFTLDAHPFPPAVSFHNFAGQLFIAHIVFGLFAGLSLSFLNTRT